jgi:hypothetical protein
MKQKPAEWWQQTTVSSPDGSPTGTGKWYNDWTRLLLSLLFWPVFVYGMYKTILVKKKTKQIILGIVVGLFVIACFGDNNGSSSSSRPGWVSPWDHSVGSVKDYVKDHYLRDPDSYESVQWYLPIENSDGTYQVTHTFRAKNGFGGMNEETHTFTLSSNGREVLSVN